MKVKVDAFIQASTHYNQLGQLEQTKVWWEGGKIALITKLLMDELYDTVEVGQAIRLRGLRLRVIEHDPFGYYVMMDGWRAWLWYRLVGGDTLVRDSLSAADSHGGGVGVG